MNFQFVCGCLLNPDRYGPFPKAGSLSDKPLI
jgi:hypothetical protein